MEQRMKLFELNQRFAAISEEARSSYGTDIAAFQPEATEGAEERLAQVRQRLEALGQVGLADWQCHMPSELSGGQRQRVTIARALVNKPAIVFADEPTGDLDSKTSGEVMDLIMGLNRCQGTTFLIVTHDLDLADRTPRKITMKDGMIVDDARNEGYDFTCPAASTDSRLANKDFVVRKNC
jgi:ABC-type ATPase involved in cell division